MNQPNERRPKTASRAKASDAGAAPAGVSVLRVGRRIRVMLSSRSRDNFDGRPLATHRKNVQLDLEGQRLFAQQIFDVWINESAGPAPGTEEWWNECLRQAREADMVIVLYNGSAGSPRPGGGSPGICHAEFTEAMRVAPGKLRVIPLGRVARPSNETDLLFHDELMRLQLFSPPVSTSAELTRTVRQAVLDGLRHLADLGGREARRGRHYEGAALEWSRLDYAGRRKAMRDVLRSALATAPGPSPDSVIATIDGRPVLAVCDAIPASLSIAAARELVGQPFLRDHLRANALGPSGAGPVHFIACHRGVTETQAIRQLGFPDATIVEPPFGVYVADPVQKIQMIFLANCTDPTATLSRVQEAKTWLERAQEAPLLRQRAEERAAIVRTIARVQAPAGNVAQPSRLPSRGRSA